MFFENNYTYDDNMNFQSFEFCKSDQRQREPFFPAGGGNFPPIGNNYPTEFDNKPSPPKYDSDYSPNFNFPGGVFNPPGMPKSPPPNYVPRKTDSGVQKMSSGQTGGASTYAVSASSIRFCLYKYTYIWEVRGKDYWAYLLNISNRTVSGFRWFRGSWVYFGVDLRRIDSFICYRATPEDNCENCINLTSNESSLFDTSKEYSLNGLKDIYSRTLASIDIPQTKEDYITKTIGFIDDTNIERDIPCIKARNICYRITLEVTYPSTYDDNTKNKIVELADEASNDTLNIFMSNRSNTCDISNPLETYNSSLKLIPEALKAFSDSFNYKISSLPSPDEYYRNITFSIRNEKFSNTWKPYYNTNY